ncbi:unnamed protein product [Lampetra planeri]
MTTIKGKGGSASQRYRPASEYDDSALAQKREYWRLKKREQRARLSERRGTVARDEPDEYAHLSAAGPSHSGVPPAVTLRGGASSQKTSPQSPSSCSSPAKAGGGITARGPVTPPSTGGTCLSTSSSVPPLRTTGMTNGSPPPQPRASVHGACRAARYTQPSLPTATEDAANPTPQTGSALADALRAEGVRCLTEEEKAARRREQWRIKKREQRAKLAVRVTKARERRQSADGTSERRAPRRSGPPDTGVCTSLSSQSVLRAASQRLCRSKASVNVPRRDKLHTGTASATVLSQQGAHVRILNSNGYKAPQAPGHVHLGLSRGASRCKTPRHRLLEAQKTFMSQRNFRGKSLSLLTSVFGSRNLPRIDPNDTPEQVIAKRREYWRVKKREQRAKLSMEMKVRLKEKDSFMRRVKRYQSILEEMRRARALGQAAGATLSPASETIGGFIKEDGTVSVNIPQVSTYQEREEGPADGHRTLRPPFSTGGPAASGGCVMKMSVSTGTPLPSAPAFDPSLTEEQRMAKKREYWRVKKREQRAARAARLKQGAAQSRTTSVFQRRRPARPPTGSSVGRRRPPPCVPAAPLANDIKQESECMLPVDVHSVAEQTLCPDVKPPVLPLAHLAPPPPGPHPEPDPGLSADSQATTLLAVASMKKLLEESLSSVTNCMSEPAEVKRDEVTPIAADLTLQIKSWQPGSDELDPPGSPSPQFKTSPQMDEPVLSHDEPPPPLTCEHASQTPATFIVNPSPAPTEDPPSPCRTQRLFTAKTLHQNLSPPEPPKLHHLPLQHPPLLQEAHTSGSPAPQRGQSVVALSAGSSLQRKREYWKMMKRQQRARLKVQQRERLLTHTQAPPLPVLEAVKDEDVAADPCGSTPHLMPAVSPPAHESPDALASPPPEDEQWTSEDVDSPSLLPTLHPPDNPLSSIDLHPIEPPLSSRLPLSPADSPPPSPKQPPPPNNLPPPKPLAGESDEDFLRRKREYWRIKKKEQRARKAARRSSTARRSTWKDPHPPQETQAQVSGQWLTSERSSEDSEYLTSDSLDASATAASFPFSHQPPAVHDESPLLFTDYESAAGEDGALEEAAWRSRYLMDYDPLNQLLVCMVCGELQYSHSVDGARTHIDEVHPHTLALEPVDRQRILDAWDEQLSQRTRFFTSQLQQNAAAAVLLPVLLVLLPVFQEVPLKLI